MKNKKNKKKYNFNNNIYSAHTYFYIIYTSPLKKKKIKTKIKHMSM